MALTPSYPPRDGFAEANFLPSVLARVGPSTISKEKVHRVPDFQVDPVAELVEEGSHESASALRRKSADGAILAQGHERIRLLPANGFKAALGELGKGRAAH